jgi:hypothetical protein
MSARFASRVGGGKIRFGSADGLGEQGLQVVDSSGSLFFANQARKTTADGLGWWAKLAGRCKVTEQLWLGGAHQVCPTRLSSCHNRTLAIDCKQPGGGTSAIKADKDWHASSSSPYPTPKKGKTPDGRNHRELL